MIEQNCKYFFFRYVFCQIFQTLSFLSSLKRASQLDPSRRRSTRKIAENKHVSVTKKRVDEINDKEPRVSQYLKIEHDNRRKGSNSLIWTVSEKTVYAKNDQWQNLYFVTDCLSSFMSLRAMFHFFTCRQFTQSITVLIRAFRITIRKFDGSLNILKQTSKEQVKISK